jgi:hypothetical protein
MTEVLRKEILLPRLTLTVPVLGVPVKVFVTGAVSIGAQLIAAMEMQLTIPLSNTKVFTISYTAENGWSSDDSNQELSSGSLADSQLSMTQGSLQASTFIALGFKVLLPLVTVGLEFRAYASVQLLANLRTFVPRAGVLPFTGTQPLLADTISLRYGLQVSADAQAEIAGFKLGGSASRPLVDRQMEAVTLPAITVQVRGFGCLADGRRYVHLESQAADGLRNSLLPATAVQWFLNASDQLLSLYAQNGGADVLIPPAGGTGGAQQVAAVLRDATAFVFGTPAFPGGGFRVLGAFPLAGVPVPQCCGDADCGAGQQCDTGACVRRGNPRFSLYWEGDSDLDLHVITPGGYEIYFQNLYGDGGRLDVDRIPSAWGRWIENVFWPPDGSAPRGRYTYWVHNYRGQALPWTLRVFQINTVVEEKSGVVGVLAESTRYEYVNY